MHPHLSCLISMSFVFKWYSASGKKVWTCTKGYAQTKIDWKCWSQHVHCYGDMNEKCSKSMNKFYYWRRYSISKSQTFQYISNTFNTLTVDVFAALLANAVPESESAANLSFSWGRKDKVFTKYSFKITKHSKRVGT